MNEFLRLITLQDANTRVVLLGVSALGVAAAAVGTLAILRRRSLMGDAVAHAALPGLCCAYFVVGERHFAAFLFGALIFGALAAGFVGFVKSHTRIKEDAAIALVIGGFFGLGVVLSRIIQNQPEGNRAGLDSFIFGKAAGMLLSDARLIVVITGALIAILVLFYKEFKVLCFDRDYASAQGWPTWALDLLIMLLICICTVVGLPAVGVVLLVALLVIPPAAARFWTEQLNIMMVLAGVFGGASGLLGAVLSATLPAPAGALIRGWPTGPIVVLVAATIFLVSLLAAPRRGIMASAWRSQSLRRKIALQNLLRDVYEVLEKQADGDGVWAPEQLSRQASRHRAVLSRAIQQGMIARREGGFVLTASGRDAAAHVVRTHRLWELYLIEQADIAPDHVDRDADQIEHILSPEVIGALEGRLKDLGRLPETLLVPSSPHATSLGASS